MHPTLQEVGAEPGFDHRGGEEDDNHKTTRIVFFYFLLRFVSDLDCSYVFSPSFDSFIRGLARLEFNLMHLHTLDRVFMVPWEFIFLGMKL